MQNRTEKISRSIAIARFFKCSLRPAQAKRPHWKIVYRTTEHSEPKKDDCTLTTNLKENSL